MNWFLIILCVILGALFPDLPLLAGRMWGYESHAPIIVSGAMFLASAIFLFVYIFTTAMNGGRWLASAFTVISLIGIGSGLLAGAALLGVVSVDFYHVFRGFPSHVLQAVAVVLLLLHVFENTNEHRMAS